MATASAPSVGRQTLSIPVGDVRDTLTIVSGRGGSALLTVKSPAGALLLRVPHGGQALVADFGGSHAPVLVVRGDDTECGSGGCTYETFTFDPVSNRVIPVPAPAVTAYRFGASGSGIITTSIPEPGGIFGFLTPNAHGFALSTRLYDLYQHLATTEYAYAENGTPAGAWTAVGPPSYSPTAWEGVPFTSAATAVEGLLQARSLNLPLQGEPLIVPGETATVWNALAPLARWGDTFTPDSDAPTTSQSGTNTVVAEEVSGVAASGSASVLQAFQLSAVLSAGPNGGFRVESVTLAPVPLPIDSAVLALQAARRAVRDHAVKGPLPTATLAVFPVGLSWQIVEGGGPNGTPWASVDAIDGQVKLTAT